MVVALAPAFDFSLTVAIAGVIIAVVALVVALPSAIAALKELTSKRVVCEVVASIPLISIHDKVAHSQALQVSYAGKPVHDVRAISIRVHNAGSQPIGEADYAHPIRFSFSEGAEVLSADVSTTRPLNVGATVTTSGTSVVLNPVLLNSGDIVEIDTLVSGHRGDIGMDARIVGVRDKDIIFRQEAAKSSPPIRMRAIGPILWVSAGALVVNLLVTFVLRGMLPSWGLTSGVVGEIASGTSAFAIGILLGTLARYKVLNFDPILQSIADPFVRGVMGRRTKPTRDVIGASPVPTATVAQPTESADDLVTRGTVLTRQVRYAEAIPYLDRATQSAPNSFSAWYSLGFAYSELDQWQQALQALDRAIAIDPNSAHAWYLKGLALRELGRGTEAQEVRRHSRELPGWFTDDPFDYDFPWLVELDWRDDE